jgi:hypothetical protein
MKPEARHKRFLQISGMLVSLSAAIYFIYYLLLKEHTFCIYSVLTFSEKWHVLAVGFIPIYLGLLIFGAAVLSLYLGTTIQRWLSQFWRQF